MQCATHLNLGWRIRVMDPDPVPTTVTDPVPTTITDSEPLTTQAVTDEGIIADSATTTSTVNESGEFTTVTADEEQGIGTAFDQVSANGEMTFNVFLTGLIIAVALAILTS